MNGKKYRELLKSLNLNAALQTQLHAGFRPDFHHAVNKYESHYFSGVDGKRWRPPPLQEDYSKLGSTASTGMKQAIRNWWKNLSPEERAIQIAKRKANASKWRQKSIRNGTIELREFTTKYLVVKAKPKTNAKRTNPI